ncbi:hypothetical protein HYPSUDRAFT_208685 [Hypholoma sublateritium FD-334 SS-4]|uniref:Uncharacterized protein n=1 Tax=Hypholoma sublateritium (strain FD-334 SS-4) TaxID=945553 RepID=A0A0D2N5K2_HYPSF|nr:hypothetical protein HYPSUDRAFT_208685 [Hypholoma sublateritium FD-334 SS-4]
MAPRASLIRHDNKTESRVPILIPGRAGTLYGRAPPHERRGPQCPVHTAPGTARPRTYRLRRDFRLRSTIFRGGPSQGPPSAKPSADPPRVERLIQATSGSPVPILGGAAGRAQRAIRIWPAEAYIKRPFISRRKIAPPSQRAPQNARGSAGRASLRAMGIRGARSWRGLAAVLSPCVRTHSGVGRPQMASPGC